MVILLTRGTEQSDHPAGQFLNVKVVLTKFRISSIQCSKYCVAQERERVQAASSLRSSNSTSAPIPTTSTAPTFPPKSTQLPHLSPHHRAAERRGKRQLAARRIGLIMPDQFDGARFAIDQQFDPAAEADHLARAGLHHLRRRQPGAPVAQVALGGLALAPLRSARAGLPPAPPPAPRAAPARAR